MSAAAAAASSRCMRNHRSTRRRTRSVSAARSAWVIGRAGRNAGGPSLPASAAGGTKTPSVTQAWRCTWWLSAEPKRWRVRCRRAPWPRVRPGPRATGCSRAVCLGRRACRRAAARRRFFDRRPGPRSADRHLPEAHWRSASMKKTWRRGLCREIRVERIAPLTGANRPTDWSESPHARGVPW